MINNTLKVSTKISVAIIICSSLLLLSMIPARYFDGSFKTEAELSNFLENKFVHPPLQNGEQIFPSRNNCKGCHGFDPQMNASIDWQGNDINVYDDWSTSMMANAAIDPFWKAKVSHEVHSNMSHQIDIETKCTSCHAPEGHFTALLRGATSYSMSEAMHDTLALQGVACGSCHMKSEDGLEELFSGEARYDTNRVIYGPYETPFAAPMESFAGFNPLYSEHINSSGICASCHTLLTNSVDLEGNYTGNQFVEQATYHEWINSDFDDDGASPTSCQGCHMPRLEDNIVIAANYLFLQPRSPFALHDMIGANVTMIELIKNNKEVLGVEAADEHFDETIAKTMEMLQKRSVDVTLSHEGVVEDTAYFDVQILNKAGHKFPSGFPSRRVFVEFLVTDTDGDTLFISGAIDSKHRLLGHDEYMEPHHSMINDENQVQIYELVLGNVNNEVTTLLERANTALKDNRLPPLGFTKNHSAYDTTKIYGRALEDQNFNIKDTGEEGAGADLIHFHIPLNGYNGLINISTKIYYQTISPRWVDPMFEVQTPQIDTFKNMYDTADVSPILVAQDTIKNLLINELSHTESRVEPRWNVYPNPTNNNQVIIDSDYAIDKVQVYDIGGRLLQTIIDQKTIVLPEEKGVYIIKVYSRNKVFTKKVWSSN